MGTVTSSLELELRESAWLILQRHLGRMASKMFWDDFATMNNEWKEWRTRGKARGVSAAELTRIKNEVRIALLTGNEARQEA